MDEPRPGEAGQAAQIDMAFLEAVMPGDIARQHAGIGRLYVACDQGDADAGLRPHAETFQHMHMRVPAANEHEIPVYRRRGLHRPALCPSAPRHDSPHAIGALTSRHQPPYLLTDAHHPDD